MEANSWRSSQADPAGGGDPGAVDWRTQLQPEARLRIVNKIMKTLKKHLPISVPEGLNELQKIANKFEEKIYTAATSQSDYLKKISLKMLSMESKTQPAPNPAMSNGPAVNQNSVEQGLNKKRVSRMSNGLLKPVKTCGRCGGRNHNKRSCKEPIGGSQQQ